MAATAISKLKDEPIVQSVWSEGALTFGGAADFMSVSQRTIYNLVAAGDLDRSKVRGRSVVPRKQCREILERGAGR